MNSTRPPLKSGILEFSPTFTKLATALVKGRLGFGSIIENKNADIQHRDGGGRHSYKYADLAAVIEATSMPLAQAGVVCLQAATTGDNGNMVSVETTLLHESGEWCRIKLSMRVQNNTPQGIGSAITYARRYSLQSLLGVAPIEDDDGRTAGLRPDGESRPRNRQQNTQQGSMSQPKAETDEQRALREQRKAEDALKPAPDGMKLAVRKLIEFIKLEEERLVVDLTSNAKKSVDELTFAEGNALLQALQHKKAEMQRADATR